MTSRSPLPRFVLLTLAWLPVTFVVWYFAAPILLYPATALAEGVLRFGFADLVRSVGGDGSTVQIVTTLKPGQATGGGQVIVDVNALLYSFGMPMFAALALAAREPAWPRIVVGGLAAMLPFIAWGIVADFLKNVAIAAGPAVASQTGFSPAQREAIAFAYQFGTLILPTVVPAALWVVTHRAFLERVRSEFAAQR
ncbi:MAG TPA: exosortase H-associated membrane protein [Casimicrobiaceae bacterium]|nr:exosortase H-associated membrane protein [Casimicrobiaceae bacterium]